MFHCRYSSGKPKTRLESLYIDENCITLHKDKVEWRYTWATGVRHHNKRKTIMDKGNTGENITIKFSIEYRTEWGESLHVSLSREGDEPVDIPLGTTDGVTWEGNVELDNGTCGVVAYRYYVQQDGQRKRVEIGVMPHTLFTEPGKTDYDCHDIWLEPRRVAGVAVPVFSLRSEGSAGVGDFGDLKLLIDWAEKTGMGAVQILPVNDTTNSGTWMDSYPYNAISVFALHPMYIDLRQLGELDDPSAMAEFEQKRKQLNGLQSVDYEAVNQLKRSYIRKMFEQEGTAVMQSDAFKHFRDKNAYWLKPYAAFSYLRDRHHTADFTRWQGYNRYNGKDIDSLPDEAKREMDFYCYMQYILHRQLLDVGNHARRKNIILKGDIPIGVSHDSADTWANPGYFNMDEQTGAPPDAFSDDGQNWGFPTYNWEAMAADGYRWWRQRMTKMGEYFSAYRIDHILGFFRIWEIPSPCKSGLMGHFSPALPLSVEEITDRGIPFIEDMYLRDPKEPERFHVRISAKKEPSYQTLTDEQRQAFDWLYEDFFYHRHTHFWYDEAMKKLPSLTCSNQMIVCGEDLGMIPECVPWVMHQLGILSLEIQSMPKAMGCEFGVLSDYPQLSVCTISSHDTPTLRGWWEEDHERAQRYFNHCLLIPGEAPMQAPGWLCEEIIRRHVVCPSVLCILTLQDWLSIDETLRYPVSADERINIPANPRHYWRYRMHLTLEALMGSEEFNSKLRSMTEERN